MTWKNDPKSGLFRDFAEFPGFVHKFRFCVHISPSALFYHIFSWFFELFGGVVCTNLCSATHFAVHRVFSSHFVLGARDLDVHTNSILHPKYPPKPGKHHEIVCVRTRVFTPHFRVCFVRAASSRIAKIEKMSKICTFRAHTKTTKKHPEFAPPIFDTMCSFSRAFDDVQKLENQWKMAQNWGCVHTPRTHAHKVCTRLFRGCFRSKSRYKDTFPGCANTQNVRARGAPKFPRLFKKCVSPVGLFSGGSNLRNLHTRENPENWPPKLWVKPVGSSMTFDKKKGGAELHRTHTKCGNYRWDCFSVVIFYPSKIWGSCGL